MVLYTDQAQYDRMGAVFINVQRLIHSILSKWIVIVCMVSSVLRKNSPIIKFMNSLVLCWSWQKARQ